MFPYFFGSTTSTVHMFDSWMQISHGYLAFLNIWQSLMKALYLLSLYMNIVQQMHNFIGIFIRNRTVMHTKSRENTKTSLNLCGQEFRIEKKSASVNKPVR